jgi:riboflavin biosynthesis pyrimidine reductase
VTPAEALPDATFELLYEADAGDAGRRLPERLRRVYGGDWRLPDGLDGRPYVYVNFVTSRDGRVSFAEPGHLGGADVAGFDRADRWLMAVLRARADAVLIGEGTVRASPSHLWIAEWIWGDEVDSFAALRAAEGRGPRPLQVVLSLAGDVPADAALFSAEGLDVVVATTKGGGARVRERTTCEVLEQGTDSVDLRDLVATLAGRFGVRTLLCEGGPHVYGSLLQASLGHDEFVTLSPLVIGESEGGTRRPSLVEGTAFAPGAAPRSRLLSVRRSGDYVYLRSRYPAV